MEQSGDPIHSNLADDESIADLLEEFVDSLHGKGQCIEDFVSQADLVNLKKIIHQLRGACGGYGFPQLTEAAEVIDENLKLGICLDDLRPKLSNFVSSLKRATSNAKD